MKLKFQLFFSARIFVVTALMFRAICASAQPLETNGPATNGAATNGASVRAPRSAEANPTDRLKEELKSHQDYLTFGLDKVPFLKEHTLLGQPLWKYLASLVYILLAFYVSRFLDYLTNVWFKRWCLRTGTKLNELFVVLLRGSVRVMAFIIFLNIGLDLFEWGAAAQAYLSKVFIIVVAASLTYVGMKLIDLFMGIWHQRTATGGDKAFDEQLFAVISKSLKIFAVIVAILMAASNLHINITGALASLSVGALAVGLAAQDTLANLFGAIAVYIDKPFRIGDQIRLDTLEGTVESIGLRSTRVRSLDGNHVTIPNKTVGNATITNITRRPNIKTEMNIGLSRDLPAERVRCALKILEEAYRSHPMTADLVLGFNRFTDSSLNIQVVHWWKGTDGKAQLAGMQDLNLKIKERFDAEGIAFATPSQTVHVKQDSDRGVAQK